MMRYLAVLCGVILCAGMLAVRGVAADKPVETTAGAAPKIDPGKTGTLEGVARERKETPCKLYVPSDYDPARKWPLIISMHGLRGSPAVDPWRSLLGGKGYLIAGVNYADVQLEPNGQWKGAYGSTKSNDDAVREHIRSAIERVCADYRVDRANVIYAGSSMGGWNIGNFCCTPDSADIFCGYIGWGCCTHKAGEANFKLVKGKPIMIYHGETCFVFKDNGGETNLKNLTEAGMILTRKIYPGQGHPVSNEACGEDVRKWFSEIRAADRLVRGYSPVAWTAATLTGAPADKTPASLAAYLKEQEFFQKRPEGKPVLLWCYTDAYEAKKGKPLAPAKETLKSDKGFADVFTSPDAIETPAAAGAFYCVNVKLDGIDKKQNPVFNESAAPLLLLVSADGQTVTPADAQLTDKAVAAKMNALLSDEQKKAAAARVAAFAAVRKQWKDLAKDYLKDKEKLSKEFISGTPYAGKPVTSLQEKQSQRLEAFTKLAEEWDAGSGRE